MGRVAHAFVLALASGAMLSAAGCGDGGSDNDVDLFESPVAEDIAPCGTDLRDVWTFDVQAGERVILLADTLSGDTAADLFLTGVCPGSQERFDGDDEASCDGAPAELGCPLTHFVAVDDEECEVAVGTFATCSDPSIAEYLLVVTRDGENAELELRSDDVDVDEALERFGAHAARKAKPPAHAHVAAGGPATGG